MNTVLMWLVDIFLAFSSLISALAFIAAQGPGLENTIIAIALSSWPPMARLMREETLSIRKMDYIAAIRLQGVSSWHIILHHTDTNVPALGRGTRHAEYGRHYPAHGEAELPQPGCAGA